MISEEAQLEIQRLQALHPDKQVMLVAEKGMMGVGSSRMSGVNNVALWIRNQVVRLFLSWGIAPIVAGTNGISPIFLTTVDVTGGIGIDLKNWLKLDSNGQPIIDADGNHELQQVFQLILVLF